MDEKRVLVLGVDVANHPAFSQLVGARENVVWCRHADDLLDVLWTCGRDVDLVIADAGRPDLGSVSEVMTRDWPHVRFVTLSRAMPDLASR